MFRMVSIIAFVCLLGGLFLHMLVFPCKLKFELAPFKKGFLNIIYALIVLGLRVSFVGLLVTGFGPLLAGGKLEGYLLMLHATCAPVFIGCATLYILINAGKFVFDKKDADFILGGCKIKGCRLTDSGIGAKCGFWVLAAMMIPLTLTMVLSMLPLFGTDVQHLLFEVHRWCALVFALAAIGELYMLVRMEAIKNS